MNSRSGPQAGWWTKLTRMAVQAAALWKEKAESARQSAAFAKKAHSIRVAPTALNALRQEWQKRLGSMAQQSEQSEKLSVDEQRIVNAIKAATAVENRNNITRTTAYLAVYRLHPELHWALLAHMVSRNGGWSMTDLEGELLSRLLDRQQRRHLFLFLERANALIFQDAYPQLLLYEWSVRQGCSLFHLLSHFHVSSFMKPLWNLFWDKRDSTSLTIGLIVNEQHYVEGRVVQNNFFKTNVLGTLAFQAQALLQLNQVLLPYAPVGEQSSPTAAHASPLSYRLAGLALEDFSDITERIGVGKRLYATIFGIDGMLEGISAFACARPHSGSRADYWPRLFTPARADASAQSYTQRLAGCSLQEGAAPLYSPVLTGAWPDQLFDPPERYDWFTDLSCVEYFDAADVPKEIDITGEAFAGLSKLELAVIAAQRLH